jgi:flagellar hook-basal body complex protein FliE
MPLPGIEAIGSVGSVGSVGAPGAAGLQGLDGLAAAYQQQVLSAGGAGLDRSAGVAGVNGVAAPDPAAAARGADFGAVIGNGLHTVESLDATAAGKAVQAATGDLTDVHDYVIAATQAQVATELTTTIRNKALEAFNDIMRMPL